MTAQQTTDDTTDELTDADLEQHWIAVLAEYWRQADWDQFSGQQKSRYDVFGERLERAKRAADVAQALDKLSTGLGIPTPELPTKRTNALQADGDRALAYLRRNKVILVNKAGETVDRYFDAMDDDSETADAGTEADTTGTTTELSDFIPEDS